MKQILFGLAAVMLFGIARADDATYEFTFSSGGRAAAGTVTVDSDSGSTVSGALSVTSGADQGVYNLLPLVPGGGDVQMFTLDGLTLSYDDLINPTSPIFVTNHGVAFENQAGNVAFVLFDHDNENYTLVDLNATTADRVYTSTTGNASISPTSVPEPPVFAYILAGIVAMAVGTRLRQLVNIQFP